MEVSWTEPDPPVTRVGVADGGSQPFEVVDGAHHGGLLTTERVDELGSRYAVLLSREADQDPEVTTFDSRRARARGRVVLADAATRSSRPSCERDPAGQPPSSL